MAVREMAVRGVAVRGVAVREVAAAEVVLDAPRMINKWVGRRTHEHAILYT